MLRYQRQNYRDVIPTEVDPDRYPVTQLKWDGIWCAVEVDQSGRLQYISRNGQLKNTETHKGTPPGLYIGEYMYGSEWAQAPERKGNLYLFDITEFEGTGIDKQPYHARHDKLLQLKRLGVLPGHWHIVANYPTLQIDSIWQNLVDSGRFEGVVFRNFTDTWHVDILRAKKAITVDLRVLDFVSGKGRLENTLGAIVAIDSEGRMHTVGGGLTDRQRKEIWSNRNAYIGRTFICECKKIFASGQLRHPNFKSWHLEK